MKFTDKDGDVTLSGGISIASIIIFLLGSLVVFGMWGCPQYNVYSARKEGEAVLAHAQSSREVAVAEAKARWNLPRFSHRLTPSGHTASLHRTGSSVCHCRITRLTFSGFGLIS